MNRLKGEYFLIHNLEYRYNGTIGEIDLLATYKDLLLQFEVKTTDSDNNRLKAIEQLERASIFLKDHFSYKKLGQFYVTPNKIEWIQNGR